VIRTTPARLGYLNQAFVKGKESKACGRSENKAVIRASLTSRVGPLVLNNHPAHTHAGWGRNTPPELN